MNEYRFQHTGTICFSVRAENDAEAIERAKAVLAELVEAVDWPSDELIDAAAGMPEHGIEARAYLDADEDALEIVSESEV